MTRLSALRRGMCRLLPLLLLGGYMGWGTLAIAGDGDSSDYAGPSQPGYENEMPPTTDSAADSIVPDAGRDSTHECMFGLIDKWDASTPEVFTWLVAIILIFPGLLLASLSLAGSNPKFFRMLIGWPPGGTGKSDFWGIPNVFVILVSVVLIILFLAILVLSWCISGRTWLEVLAINAGIGLYVTITTALMGRLMHVLKWERIIQEKRRGRQRQALPPSGKLPDQEETS